MNIHATPLSNLSNPLLAISVNSAVVWPQNATFLLHHEQKCRVYSASKIVDQATIQTFEMAYCYVILVVICATAI